ncbi:hypothetical protein [Serpentinimonas maccroryi]|uniref:phage tail tube protein n=1 Tax=Serpentinimonas maccroryi TaxID=1458426 RepID=UPI0020335443|nr:hypothetical protein [Serpentinimonas maccroryi]MCM2480203.1 hypothetical protein [Serpentinimonas maccroryi]
MTYFSGQGRVFLAQRDPNGNPLGLRWVGNVPNLSVRLSVETFEHKEATSGLRLNDVQMITGLSGELACTLEALNPDNLELALYGVTESVTAGTVAAETLPAGIVAGETRLLAHQFVSAVAVLDANAQTLPAANYSVHAGPGSISFNDLSTGGPYTQPFSVAYAHAPARRVGMFRSAAPEVWLRFDGINTADRNRPVLLDLYRVAINPLEELSLISDELLRMDLSGRVLADATKPLGGALGQFGRMVLQG